MGIWEMRNPYYVEQIIHKLVEYNNNKELEKIGYEYYGNKPISQIEETKNCYPKLVEKLDKAKLQEVSFQDKIQDIQDAYVKTDIITYIDKLSKYFSSYDYVLCHNDPQQGNILVDNQDGSKVYLIDYEELNFGPRFWDLASFLHCFMKDNDHPDGIQLSPMNAIEEFELRHYVEYFLTVQYQTLNPFLTLEIYLEDNRQQFFEQVICSMVIQNILFGIWSIARGAMRADDVQSDEVYYQLAWNRVQMNKSFTQLAYVQKVINKYLN